MPEQLSACSVLRGVRADTGDTGSFHVAETLQLDGKDVDLAVLWDRLALIALEQSFCFFLTVVFRLGIRAACDAVQEWIRETGSNEAVPVVLGKPHVITHIITIIKVTV